MVRLSDGTYIAQTLHKNEVYDERIEDKGDAVFMVFNKDRLEVIRAKFEPNVNFSYNSIIGKGMTTPDDMAKGYTLVRKMIVEDGNVDVESYRLIHA